MEFRCESLRYGLKALVRSPRFASLLVMMLALGIGATTTVFSFVSAVLLSPLPYADADRLAFLWGSKNANVTRGISGPELADLREQNHVFEDIAVFLGSPGVPFALASNSGTVDGLYVSPELFPLLRTPAYWGRTFLLTENQPTEGNVVILAYSLWKKRFGGNREIIGNTVSLDGLPHTVVGVMPPEFFFPDSSIQLWVPLRVRVESQPRGKPLLHAIVRIKKGYTFAQGQTDLDVISERLASTYPETGKEVVFGVFPLVDQIVGRHRAALWSLFGGATLLLLIVCANAAHMLLARGIHRGAEMSIRLAFGATRSALIQQLLIESLLLGVVGGVLGIALAFGSVRLLLRIGLPDIPRFGDARVDGATVIFACTVSLLIAILFGLVPAIRGSRFNMIESLKQGSAAYSYGRKGYLRDLMIASEVAFAFMLVAGSGLLINSFVRLLHVDWGFRADHVLITRVRLPRPFWTNIPLQESFAEQAYRNLRRLPGTQAVGMGAGIPIRWTGWKMRHVRMNGHQSVLTREWIVGPGFLEALGIPLLRGRETVERDGSVAPKVAIVSSSLAEELWPNRNAIGSRLDLMAIKREAWDALRKSPRAPGQSDDEALGDPKLWDSISYEIVGIAKEVRMFGLKPVDSMPSIYIDYRQRPADDFLLPSETFILRTAGDPMSLAVAARGAIQDLNRELIIEETATMDQLVSEATGGRGSNKLLLVVSSSTSILGLLIASLGIYSVLSYATAARSHEIGVRLALGAHRGQIFRLIMERSMLAATAGVLVGLSGANAANRMLTSYLYGVGATDPATLVSAVLLFIAVGFFACYWPARHAIRQDPMATLRYE